MQTTDENVSFVKKNISYIIIVGLLCTIGINNGIILGVAVAVIAIIMLFSSTENAFCWSLFLIPNIRIFDNIGTEIIVNVLTALPLIPYISRNRYGIKTSALAYGVCMIIIEFSHSFVSPKGVFTTTAWVMIFILCYCVTTDKNIKLKPDDMILALTSGVIFSSITYLINNPWFTSDLSNKLFDYRFEAYGDDPNYFSLYLCLCCSAIVIKEKIQRKDYYSVVILVIIGLMTTSKMCLILISLNILYLIFLTSQKSVRRMVANVFFVVILSFLIVYFKDTLLVFVEQITKRAGGDNITMRSFTTGRSTLLADYWHILLSDSKTLLAGKGFSYYVLLTGQISHNTYIDVVASWGFFGGAALMYIFTKWFNAYKERLGVKRFSLYSKFPFFILLLGFMALSCFSAQMFFFVITFAMLQLRPIKSETNTNL